MVAPWEDMNQICRVSIEGSFEVGPQTQSYVNVMHWIHIPGLYSNIEMAELADIYEANILPAYMDMYYDQVTHIANLRLRQIAGPVMEEYNRSLNLWGTRTLDGDLLPPYLAFVMSLYTPNLGKRFRGRQYFGGFAEQDQEGGIWNTDMYNLVAAYQGSLIPYYSHPGFSGDWTIGVLSDPFRTLPDLTPLGQPESPFCTAVDRILPKLAVYTQKKRKFHGMVDIF